MWALAVLLSVDGQSVILVDNHARPARLAALAILSLSRSSSQLVYRICVALCCPDSLFLHMDYYSVATFAADCY